MELQDAKLKLEQKKHRLAAEEIRLKLKERKMRTRKLIEIGGLAAKSEIDFLTTTELFGAFLFLKDNIQLNPKIIEDWNQKGKHAFDIETNHTTSILLKFEEQPDEYIRKNLRLHKLKWNKYRAEWYGNIANLDDLKSLLENIQYELQIIQL